MSTERQYLNKEQIHNLLGEPQAQGLTLVSTDNYNEEQIAQKIKSFGPQARDILFDATLNNAIIGYGQKNFGVVKIEDKYLEIHDIYQKYGVSLNNPPGSTIGDDELTPNRLMRFFRYDIRDWIKKNKQGSFLWRKYSRRDPDMMPTTFRGAEYLEDLTQQQADYLIETVMNLDRAQGTNMVDRILRAFDATGQKYTLLPRCAPAGGLQSFTDQKQRTHPGVLHDHPVGQQHEQGEKVQQGQQQFRPVQQEQFKSGQQEQFKSGQQQQFKPGQQEQSRPGQQEQFKSGQQEQFKSGQQQQFKPGQQEQFKSEQQKKVQQQGQSGQPKTQTIE